MPNLNTTPLQTFTTYAMGFMGVLIFGATLPVTTIALADFSPWFLTFARALIGGILSLIWLVATGRSVRHEANTQLFIAGALLIFGFPGLMGVAMQKVPASHGGMVLGILPFLTAGTAVILAKERQSAGFWGLALLGNAVVIGFVIYNSMIAPAPIKPIDPLGYIWMFGAALCAAVGYVVAGRVSRTISGPQVICRALILNMPIIVFGTVILWDWRYLEATHTGLLALSYLGLFSMFLAFFLWNTALARGGIGRVGQLQLLQVFVTLLAAAVLLGEKLEPYMLVTAILVTAIVWISRRI